MGTLFRFSVIDLCAVVVLAAVFALPAREYVIEPLYADATESDLLRVAMNQAEIARSPGSGVAAAGLGAVLRELDQDHFAMRAAGDVAMKGSPDEWRAWLAVSEAHADRVEVDEAFQYAEKSLNACQKAGADCPEHEAIRLDFYYRGLKAGVESGVDVREDPEAFRRALMLAFPRARFRGGR